MTDNGRPTDRDVPPGTTQMKDSDVPRDRTAAVRMPSDRAVEAAPPNRPPCQRGDNNRSDIVDGRTTRARCAIGASRLARWYSAFVLGGAHGPRASTRRAPDGRVDRVGRAFASGGRRVTNGRSVLALGGAGRRGVTVWRDEGVATVFACLALAALIGATLLIAQVGAVVVARHRAQAAADLAALAAAGELARGADVGCTEAAEIARRMEVRIQQCEVVQWDATVTVEENVPMGLLGKRTVRAVARAGPVEVGA